MNSSSSAKTLLSAISLLNAGHAKAAEELILAHTAHGGDEGLLFYLGLAYAQQNNLDKAIEALLRFLKREPRNPSAKRTTVTLLHKQAVQKINAADWAGAGSALGNALQLDPENHEIQALLASVENVLPLAYLKADRRQDAANAWEKVQRHSPELGEVAHSLALLYFHGAMELEHEGKSREADDLWHKAIANRVTALYCNAFWARWAKQRNTVYAVTDSALANVRTSWAEDLIHRFRTYAEEYQKSGRLADAERHRNLEVLYWVERTTACALFELKKAPCPHCHQIASVIFSAEHEPICEHTVCRKSLLTFAYSHHVPVCGPLMLQHLEIVDEARQLVNSADTIPNSVALTGDLTQIDLPFVRCNMDVLNLCLSSSSRAFAHLVHRRFEEAIDCLSLFPLPKASSASSPGRRPRRKGTTAVLGEGT